MASTAEKVINKFGGISALAQALGHKHPTTVQGWKERGFIPSRRQDEVLAAAHKEDIDLKPEDFFEHTNGGAREARQAEEDAAA